MSAKQSSWCCCFSGRPPEITRLEVTAQPIQIDIPLPDDENEINAKFSEIVVKL
jgi:hypothetical protein